MALISLGLCRGTSVFFSPVNMPLTSQSGCLVARQVFTKFLRLQRPERMYFVAPVFNISKNALFYQQPDPDPKLEPRNLTKARMHHIFKDFRSSVHDVNETFPVAVRDVKKIDVMVPMKDILCLDAQQTANTLGFSTKVQIHVLEHEQHHFLRCNDASEGARNGRHMLTELMQPK